MFLQFVVSGALVGFIVGATGVGGGSLMTPLLTLFFGVPAQVAVGTDLLFAAVTKSGGAITYARRGDMPWSVVIWMALGSVPASLCTTGVLRWWQPDAAQFAALVRPLLGAALLLTSSALFFRTQIREFGRRLAKAPLVSGGATLAVAGVPASLGGQSESARPAYTLAVGALIGVLVTLTSVGAGAIGVVALFFLYPAMSARRLVGADILHAVPLTLVAGLGHAALGTVNWTMLAALLLGSLPAIQLGALLAARVRDDVLRKLLAGLLVVIGLRLILA